jgi:hypothetical protein
MMDDINHFDPELFKLLKIFDNEFDNIRNKI